MVAAFGHGAAGMVWWNPEALQSVSFDPAATASPPGAQIVMESPG